MPVRPAEVARVFGLAALVTAAIAAPVLRAPSERVFGMEIVGRHHDPFTVMAQFERPIAIGVYSQPVTDIAGELIARLAGGVAAYNWLVLLSFPLSAAAAYLLARHVALSRAAATGAAMLYAFSPFHLAHAAYHPHIAQTQWIPLYLLALWRCLDRATPAALGFLGAATLAVTFSNFYGGLIAAVITPAAVAAYWLVNCRAQPGSIRRLGLTAGGLVLFAAAAIAYGAYSARAVTDWEVFAFPRTDLFRYSATWWSYLVPPVAHPLLGATAHQVWDAAGVREGLLEQQVSLGWGIVALGLVASLLWVLRVRDDRQPARLASVPVLIAVGVTAFLCSLAPERTIGGFTLIGPSALLYNVAPMFRSYARFGVVVQLMTALLAGIAVDGFRRAGSGRARIACLAFVVLAAGEYAVSPSALWRDVLPTAAHRWVRQQDGPMRTLDCTPPSRESESIQWLTGHRVAPHGALTNDCTEPNIPGKLAALGYTHILVRRDTDDGAWLAAHPEVDGLRAAATFDTASVFAVTARTPALYTAMMTGLFPREHDAGRSWRWMGSGAAWTVVNTTAQPIVTVLAIELSAFHRTRRMELRLDGRPVQSLVVDPAPRTYDVGPLTIDSGTHLLAFLPGEAPAIARDAIGNSDPRRLSFALGAWDWRTGDPE